tara:strand:+ start:32492 stop:33727 length:1236 start_codon:yes stop_codon:yes gene_type:complete
MTKIAYGTKVQSVSNPLPDVNKVTADNLNEIKTSVNLLYDSTIDYLLVQSASDLTSYLVGDEYILPTGLVMLNGTIDLVDKAVRVSTGTVLRGLADATLVSTNASGVVRATNISSAVILREFNVVASAGPCFVLTGTITYQLNMFFIGMFGVKSAIITGFNVQGIKGCFNQCADGITFAGTTTKVFVSESPFYDVTGSAITFDAALITDVVDIETSFFKFDSPGVAITAEVGYTVREGLIRGSLATGTSIPLVGLSSSDLNWRMTNNTGIADSRVVGGFYLSTAVETVISATSTPVKVLGTTLGLSLNQRFTATNNRLTYTGVKPSTSVFMGNFTVDSGNNVVLNFYIAKNGVVLPESQSRVRVGSGADERAGSLNKIVELVTGDYVEIWAENVDSTANLTCLSLSLNGIG